MVDMPREPDSDQNRFLVELVNEYQEMLLHMCYVYLRDQEMARDAVQETFLKACRNLNAFRGESNVKTWLIRIAINTCKSMQRSAWLRHHDRRITPEDLPQTAMISPANDLDLMCDIMQLPSKLKEVILLYYWQNMNVSQIAQSLGIAQSTVTRRLQHARDTLHNMLERRDMDGRP